MAQKPWFRSHSFPEEFRDARVREMIQSASGYIWLGCQEGLFRFDGFAATPVRVGEKGAPFSVRSLYEDNKGRLWVGLESGEIYFLDHSGIPVLWDIEEGLPQAPVVAFAEDTSGNFWIATYGEGLYCWKSDRLYNFSTEDGLGGNDIYDMDSDTQGQIWCGTDRGINLVSWEGGRKKIEALGREEGLPDEIVRFILSDGLCGVWVGMHDGGVCRIDPQTREVDYLLPSWKLGVVTALACFHDREIWIGTESHGLLRLDLASRALESLSPANGKPGSHISALLRDDEGSVWLAGNNTGFFSANRHFEFAEGSPSDIQAVLADHSGQVWAGTQQGLFKKMTGQDSFVQVLPHLPLNVVSLYEDPYQNIWIGTFGQGVFGFHPPSGKVMHLDEGPNLVNGSILSIDGRDSLVWLATLGGVTQWTFRGDPLAGGALHSKAFDQESGLGANYIYRVMVDSKGRTWFGTDGKGLSMMHEGKIQSFTHADTIPLRAVYSLAEDGKGHIWFSTSNQGIFRFDGKQFHKISLKEGIRNLSISGIAATSRGEILIVHRNGMDLLDPETGHLIYYDEEVGIPDQEPNLNALHADRRGNIWVGLPNSLIRFSSLGDPLRIHPLTRLENVFVLLDPINWREQTEFSHLQNFLVFDFVGIWLTDPQSVTYRFKLEGYDRDWIYSRDHRATYSNLPPGRYTFMVSSTENSVFLDEPVVRYSFRIRAPLWQRWWFILLAILTLSGSAYALIKNRDVRLQRLEKLKQESIRSQYEALKSQINPHFLFNSFNTLAAFIEENPRQAVEYVEKLSDFYRVALAHREKDKISLEEELRMIRDFGYLLEKRFGRNFTLEIDVPQPQGYFVAPLALQILVENAIKHNIVSKARPLKVRIEIQSDDSLLVVNSLQKKLTAESSTGFGLMGIIKRYALLTSRPVVVEETSDEFRVRIPLLK